MYLNCHTYYSLRYGTISIEQLIETAVQYGITALALTDINNTSAVFDFVRLCRKANIHPVVGVDFREGDQRRYVCLAQTLEGFAEINRFYSQYTLAHKPFPLQAPAFEHVFTLYPLGYIESLRANEYIGVRVSDITKLWRNNNTHSTKYVLCQPVSFLDKTGYNLHRLLRASDHNCLLSKLPSTAHATEDELFVPPTVLRQRLASCEHLIARANQLLSACCFDFDFQTPKNRKVYTTTPHDDLQLLTKLAWDGYAYRYGKRNRLANERIEKELRVIHELHFSSYFLITWDIIRYARSRGYFHVGRGSGANSIVAYCLGITDVDPIELDLYFERFINPHRTSPPDFDIDFSWDERDEIIDYIFKRYGHEYVCLLATYVTFNGRAQYRELGKVFGLPKPEIDALLTLPDQQMALTSQWGRLISIYGKRLEGFPHQLSIHAGGILISDQALVNYTGLNPMPKGFPINQFDMYVAEDIGFAKFDILSQRGLGHIKMAVDIIRQNRQVDVDIHAVQRFMQDSAIRAQLQSHETMGCFYIESPAMRQLIWKLRCDNYLTLVAASSIIRPGVASSGMMAEYIHRHHHPEDFVPVHPFIGTLLQETYGVMVYQEDVIKVAHYFAGLSLAEADNLRRGMSGKYRSRIEFDKIREVFFTNCEQKGYALETTQEVWRQIESFSGYSFSKAHSASFAVESYQSLFLKTYYPLEFMVAVINNFGGYYQTQDYLHEAHRWGAHLEAPDINRSEYLTTIEGHTLWLGWVHVQGLERKTSDWILAQREIKAFENFDDFCRRVPIGLEQLSRLIRVGAFRAFHSKKGLLWEAHLKLNKKAELAATGELFALPKTEFTLPTLRHEVVEDAYDELELLGFPLVSAFSLLQQWPSGYILAKDLTNYVGQVVCLMGYYVTYKPTTTKQRERMFFGYFHDEQGAYFDTVHFPKVAQAYPLKGRAVYWIKGKVQQDFGHAYLVVSYMEKLPFLPDPRNAESW